MAKEQFGYWDYVKGAYKAKAKLKGLGEVPVNQLFVLAVGVLGLSNPGFWVLGAGLELAFLFLASHDPRFRKWMNAVAAAERSGDWEARKKAMLDGLSRERSGRYESLEQNCSELIGLGQKLGGEGTALEQQAYDGVNKLLWIFLKLLVSAQVLDGHLRATSRKQLEQEIAQYEKDYQQVAEDPSRERVARSLHATLELARKRMENLNAAWEQVQFIHAELIRIEQQVALILQEAALARDSTFLTERVDTVMSSFAQTQDWMKAHAQILGPVEEELETPPPTFQMQR
ncbi:MAG: hypothetical protein HY319_09425 [Armatimonadetes bacterium]|nr:hypothetical protein [Armatimonadota bacterium]